MLLLIAVKMTSPEYCYIQHGERATRVAKTVVYAHQENRVPAQVPELSSDSPLSRSFKLLIHTALVTYYLFTTLY